MTQRVFVYEQVTALKIGLDLASPLHSLYLEGRAMFAAVQDDFNALEHVEAITMALQTPSEEHDEAFASHVRRADATLLIAPETAGELERLSRRVLSLGGKLLGPGPDAIALCADKWQLFQHWQQCGVSTPFTHLATTAPRCYPAVLKPRDGAGSCDTFLIRNPADWETCKHHTRNAIVQDHAPGQPAGVSFIVQPDRIIPLEPTLQKLSPDGRFHYLGGVMPLSDELRERAIRIASQAMACVPGLFGYFGVDVLLGDGCDVAIEINPRLTTSYIGLRRYLRCNLAGLMLGQTVSNPLPNQAHRVEFAASGAVSLP